MNQNKLKTINYYNQHSQEFIEGTLNVDMTALYNRFLPLLPKNGKILDIGCGPGRDSLYFKRNEFYVESFDASSALIDHAKQLGLNPILADFETFETETLFDGLWACASLLHASEQDLKSAIPKLLRFLKNSGYFYLSFKYGHGEEFRNGRYFQFFDEGSFESLISNLNVEIQDLWTTSDVRPGREDKWLNVILKKI